MISVLILTYQEEANLPRCLDALAWCDDVVVLDSFSGDRTVEIARAYGARVLQRAFDDFASQRNFGIANAGFRHEWVLHLDADEVVTEEFRAEMQRVLASTTADAFRVPSKMIFRGVWLKHAGLYPSYQVRLGRRDRLVFHQIGHGQRETLPGSRLGTMRTPLLHYSFAKGLTNWFERHNRYSSAEAAMALTSHTQMRVERLGWRALRDPLVRRRALKAMAGRLPFRPTLRFLYMYLWRRGFLDGRPGLEYCRMLAMYEYMIVLKTRELVDQSCGAPCEAASDERAPLQVSAPILPSTGAISPQA